MPMIANETTQKSCDQADVPVPQEDGDPDKGERLPIKTVEEVIANANAEQGAPPTPLGGRVFLGKSVEHGIEPPEELEPGILLDGLVHILHGPSGGGKTWVLLWLLKRAIERGKRVVYFDAENGPRIISERLQDLGVHPAVIDENLNYYPFPHLTLESKSVREYAALLDTLQPDLVAFDATVNFLGTCGLEESSNDDFVKWCVRYTRPARERNIAVVLLDHPGHEGTASRAFLTTLFTL
jgi:hypothetical protein